MRTLIPVTLLTAALCMAQTLFEDDFDDGDAEGWLEVVSGPVYEVNEDLRYEMSYSGSENLDAVSVSSDFFPLQMSTPDYSVLVEVLAHDPCDEMAVCARANVSGSEPTGYLAMLRFDINQVLLLRYDGTYEWIILDTASFQLGYEELYWVRFQCDGDSFTGKVWQGTVGDEPDEWLVMASDQTYPDPGYFGLLAAAFGTGDYDGEFDNVCVTTPVISLVPSTWAVIKAGE